MPKSATGRCAVSLCWITGMNRLRWALASLRIKRGDMILLTVLLTVSAAMGILFAVSQPKPEYVSVREDGMEIARLPLNIDRVYRINDSNTIEISGKSVRMTEASCPDRICIKTGAISRSGQSIVCAPHRIVVTIIGDREPSPYDAITNLILLH